jgi:hypothetical protein
MTVRFGAGNAQLAGSFHLSRQADNGIVLSREQPSWVKADAAMQADQ